MEMEIIISENELIEASRKLIHTLDLDQEEKAVAWVIKNHLIDEIEKFLSDGSEYINVEKLTNANERFNSHCRLSERMKELGF